MIAVKNRCEWVKQARPIACSRPIVARSRARQRPRRRSDFHHIILSPGSQPRALNHPINAFGLFRIDRPGRRAAPAPAPARVNHAAR